MRRQVKAWLIHENRIDSCDSLDAGEEHQNRADVEPTQHKFDEVELDYDNGDLANDQISINDQSAYLNESSAESLTSETVDESETAEAASDTSSSTVDDVERMVVDIYDSEVDDDIFNDENTKDQEIEDEPLYDGAPLTVSESLMTILNFSLPCNMTAVQLTEALRIIEFLCPHNNKCVKTLHKLKKHFSKSSVDISVGLTFLLHN